MCREWDEKLNRGGTAEGRAASVISLSTAEWEDLDKIHIATVLGRLDGAYPEKEYRFRLPFLMLIFAGSPFR